MKKIIIKLKKIWMNFWGKKYRIYEEDIPQKEMLIYHRKIFIYKLKKGSESNE